MLDKYVIEVQEYLRIHPDLKEEEIVMYVYLDLASRLKFDDDFFFGGTKKRNEIYTNAAFVNELNRCLEDNKIICKSASYIMEYVLKKIGINIITVSDGNPLVRYNHVLNIIIPKDGSSSYKIDLQNDISNIHYHGFTSNFGMDIYDDEKYIISPDRQRKIHEKLNYVSKDNPYTDEYLELFKIYLPIDLSFTEKIDHVLKNIDPVPYPNVSYWERRWKHEKMLSNLFDSKELERKLLIVEFYKDNGYTKVYNNGFFINTRDGVIVYYYSKNNFQYESYSLKEFAKKVIAENICYRQGIMGLNHELKELRNQKVKKI